MSKSSLTVDIDDLGPLMKGMVVQLAAQKRGGSKFTFDPADIELEKAEKEAQANEPKLTPLVKSVLNLLNGGKDSIERLAFDTDPAVNNTYGGLYKNKLKLLPDELLKRIAIQDDLVAAIVQARQSHMASFGRPREDRFSKGFAIEPKKGALDEEGMDEGKKKELQDRIDRAVTRLANCGSTEGWGQQEKTTFAQWLSMSTRNAIVVGRLATEIVWADTIDGDKVFHSFRVADAGTIYRAAPQKDALDKVREAARHLLEQINNEKLDPEKYMEDEYEWVQVIGGRPVQAFTESEMLVHNFYPVTDVELNGYPVTPLDTVMNAVTTHLNIEEHNKLYFQSGRAARGMLLIQSDDVDEGVVQNIKQQFQASINSVQNAWRMPVFGLGKEDAITWQPIDSGSRDMEFQYLSDSNARTILSAFQMSPEELPGYAHLSRGTNSQALSEGNNEYKMEAARDVGLRPLISQFEDFINARIFPLIDPKLAKICTVKLLGLDAETAEKESVRLQQDMGLHMTYDQVLGQVEKDPIPKELAGDFLLNQLWQAQLDKYVYVGVIREKLLGIAGASKDPAFQYVRDPFWFQWQQFQLQAQQMQQQAQQQQQGGGQPPGGGGGAPQGGGGGGGGDGGGGQDDAGPRREQVQTERQKSEQSKSGAPASSDLSRGIDQAIGALTKREAQLPPSRRRLLDQHQRTVEHFLAGLESDRAEAMKIILGVVEKAAPPAKK
jgi:uncharacterized membrane protein YgcG